MSTISVVIATEKGRFEGEAKMLIDSIRQFGGRFKNVPIYSYQPRKTHAVSKETIRFFEKNEVEFVDINLNKSYPNYPLANKILVNAHAENNINTEVIVYMDCDSVVWKEPKVFYEMDTYDFAAVPVFQKFGVAAAETDEKYEYWKRMADIQNLKLDHHVNTVVDNQRILAYYQGGLFVSKKSTGLFQQTLGNFEHLLKLDPAYFKHHFLEQSNYSITALSLGLKIRELPRGYNYPLNHHGDVRNPNYQLNHLDEVITGHYTILFKKAKWYRNPLRGNMIEGEKGEWFRKKASEYGLNKSWYQKLFKK